METVEDIKTATNLKYGAESVVVESINLEMILYTEAKKRPRKTRSKPGTGGAEGMNRNKDRIECAIRHIQTAVDIDPWVCDLAVEALRKELERSDQSENPERSAPPETYEYHYDHTDCIWYRPEARNRCPSTCAQYRDGWNDAMNYVYRDGKGYRPYRRDERYGE